MRVQQTIRSQESSIVSYKIANLLQFYLITMRRTIGEALLSSTLKEYVFKAISSHLFLNLLFKDYGYGVQLIL